MITAIQDGVVFILRLVHKVMGYQFPGHAFCFVLFIIRTQNLQLSAVAQLRKEPFFKDVWVVSNKDVRRLQDTP